MTNITPSSAPPQEEVGPPHVSGAAWSQGVDDLVPDVNQSFAFLQAVK